MILSNENILSERNKYKDKECIEHARMIGYIKKLPRYAIINIIESSLRKICQNTVFVRPLFSRIRTESKIPKFSGPNEIPEIYSKFVILLLKVITA